MRRILVEAIKWIALIVVYFLIALCLVVIFSEPSGDNKIFWHFILKLLAYGIMYSTYKVGVWFYEHDMLPRSVMNLLMEIMTEEKV